jgi:hypothetical protein
MHGACRLSKVRSTQGNLRKWHPSVFGFTRMGRVGWVMCGVRKESGIRVCQDLRASA